MNNKKHNQKIGKIGEEAACKFLMKQGYQIITRNYQKKWGEIDIVSRKNGLIYFIEVKTLSKNLSLRESINNVSCENNINYENNVKHETIDEYRPEDNIHHWKLKRLSRVIQSYLIENYLNKDCKWQFDALTVFLDTKNKIAQVKHIKDIVL